MKIAVKYIRTDINYEYRREYSGFVLSSFDAKNKSRNAVCLSGACLWKLDRLQRTLKMYEEIL